MAHADRHLRIKRNRFFVTVWVPLKLQSKIGRKVIERTTGTDSLSEARRRAPAILAAIQSEFKKARDGGSDPVAEAMSRRVFDLADPVDIGLARIRSGETPIKSSAEKWYEEIGATISPQTITMHKQSVGLLLAQFGSTGTVESIDRGRASTFLSALIKQPGRDGKTPRSRATLRRIKSSLSSLWEWLIEGWPEERPALENPWRGHGRKLKDERRDEEKRLAFSDEQLAQLLQGEPEQAGLADVIRIGMFSGMRVSEICDRKVGDVRNGAWHVTEATKKTQAAKRAVPIHPAIAKLVARRVKGKAADDPVFPDIPRADKGKGKRNKTASKWFGRYADSLEIKDKRLVFHSLRHNVYTALGNLGVAPRVRDSLLGHKGHGMAATYDKGPDWSLRKAGMASLRYSKAVMDAV